MDICPPSDQEKMDNQYINMQIVARNIYNLRKQKGWSQIDLAINAGIQVYQVSKLEWRTPHLKKSKKDGKIIVDEKYYCASFKTLCLIARAFDVSISDLVREDLF
jgi:hypothetical protein